MIGNDIVDLQQAKLESNWRRPRYLGKIFTKNEFDIIEQVDDKDLIIWQLWSMKEAVYKIVSRRENRRFFAPKHFECSLLGGNFKLPPNLSKGKISYKNHHFFSNTIFNKNHIHTIAGFNYSTQAQYPDFPKSGELEEQLVCLFLRETSDLGKSGYWACSKFSRNLKKKRQLKYFRNNAKLLVPPSGGQGVIYTSKTFKILNSKTQSQTTHQHLISKYAETANLQKSHLKIHKNEIGIPFLYYKNEKLPVQISISHHGKFGGFAIKTA